MKFIKICEPTLAHFKMRNKLRDDLVSLLTISDPGFLCFSKSGRCRINPSALAANNFESACTSVSIFLLKNAEFIA